MDNMEKVREIREEDISSLIPYIRSREAVRELREKSPNAFTIDNQNISIFIIRGKIGESFWLLEEPFEDTNELGGCSC